MTRSAKLWMWPAIVTAIALLPCGYIYHGDGEARFAQARSLFLDHTITSSPAIAFRDGRLINEMHATSIPGRYVSKYGIGIPLLWLIPEAIAWAIHAASGVPQERAARFLIGYVNPITTLLTGLLLARTLRRLAFSPAAVGWSIACWLLATSTLAYANSAFSEPVCALLILFAASVARERRAASHALGGAALGYAVLIKPELIGMAAIVPLYTFAFASRPRAILAAVVAFFVGPGVLLFVNHHVFGSALHPSYGDESRDFRAPWAALRGFAWNLDKSLLVYDLALVPAAIGWWRSRRRGELHAMRTLTAAAWLVYFPFYCCWWAWDGGLCFGPRFFVTFMPLTAVGVAAFVDSPAPVRTRRELKQTTLCLIVVAISLPIQLLGLSVHGEEAVEVADRTGCSALYAAYRLTCLKLAGGVFTDEIYPSVDFDPTMVGRPPIRFDDEPNFAAFRHWPLTWINAELRERRRSATQRATTSAASPHDPVPP